MLAGEGVNSDPSLSYYTNNNQHDQDMEIDKHITSSNHYNVISKYIVDGKTSSSCLRYISGFVRVTLLQGYIAINGYSLLIGESISIKCPPWTPASVLELSPRNRMTENKKEKLSKKLKRINSIISETVDDESLQALLSDQKIIESLFINMNDASGTSTSSSTSTPTVVMYHGIPVEEQEWMVAAEDLTKYNIQFDRMKQRNSNGCFDCSCVCVGSGLIGDMMSMQQSSLDITVIPITWGNTAISLYDNVKSGVESYMSDMSALEESDIATPIVDKDTFPSHLGQKYMLCGAKGVGKSTAVRYIINTLLSQGDHISNSNGIGNGNGNGVAVTNPIKTIAVLDCDAGQPEFNVPGTLSLNLISVPVTSPPHLHIQDYPPVECYFLGELTTKFTPERFSAALKLLYQKYEEIRVSTWNTAMKYQKQQKNNTGGGGINSIPVSQSLNKFDLLNTETSYIEELPPIPCDGVLPLLINCDGNIRFMGNEILSAVINVCQPTDVLHISTDKDRVIPAIHHSEEMFNHYHAEQQSYRQAQERILVLEEQLEQGHTVEVEESEADWGISMSVTVDTSLSAAAAYETLTKHQNAIAKAKALANGTSNTPKKKKKNSSIQNQNQNQSQHTQLLKKQIEDLQNNISRISNTAIYPYNIYSLQPGRMTPSRIAAADLRNLRYVYII